MAELERLMPQSFRRLLELQAFVEKYGRGDVACMDQLLSLQDQISADCERIDILVRKEPPHRRQNVKHRYEQLIQETRSLNALLAKHQRQQSQQAEQEDERSQLLSRQFTANDNQDTILALDGALQFNSSAENCNRGLDVMLDQGHNVLRGLRDQKNSLKSVKKRMMDVANSLGLSQTVMKLVERRSATDQYIFYAGMVITLLIMFLLLYYVL